MAMDPSQHMLTKGEFDTLANLLARAHLSGDASILEKHVERAYQELVAGEHLEKLVDYSGGMRQREGFRLRLRMNLNSLMVRIQLKLPWKRKLCRTW